MDRVKGYLRDITDLAIGLIALGVAVNIAFGAGAFVPDVIGNITSIISALAAEQLVGLVTLVILASLLSK